MSTTEEFDPYYKWFGIPPKDQPPNHYRLLGIEYLESDPDVIDAAANRLMAYLQDISSGDHRDASQEMLNKISAARRCLLNPVSKLEYDSELKKSAPRSVKKKRLPRAQGNEDEEGSGNHSLGKISSGNHNRSEGGL